MSATGKSVLLMLTLCLALLLGSPPALAQQPPSQTSPQRGGTLVIGFAQSPHTLNGAVQAGATTALPSAQLFAGLVRFDGDWQPQPYLARSWHWSRDHKTVTFKLRADALFHDGQPITSADVAFSILASKANHPYKSMFSAVQKIETPDPLTVVIRLSHPYPALMVALSPALCPILPKHIYDDGKSLTDLRSNPRNSQDVVGSGPFKLVRFVPGKEIVLKRFDRFFLKGRPYLDKLVIQLNPNTTALVFGLVSGEIQMLPFVSSPSLLNRVQKKNPHVTIINKGYEALGAELWLELNTAKKPFDDKRVRQAIAYSLDKNFITQVLFKGFALPAIGPIISSSPFATATNEYSLDLNKARQLLDEAGLKPDKKGIRLKMTMDVMPGFRMGQAVAEYTRGQLREVGIDVVIRQSPDFPSWAQRIAHHDFDMTTDIVGNWGDPVIGVYRNFLSSNIRPVVWANDSSYRNPRVDKILHQAAVETDRAKRKALYAEFQRLVTDDAPLIYLAEVPYHTLVRNNVGNPPQGIWGPLSPLDTVYIKTPAK